MPDHFARRMAAGEIRMAREQLHREARYFADAAARFADDPDTTGAGDAARLAQDAMQLALLAARLGEMRRTVAYLAPATDTPEETP